MVDYSIKWSECFNPLENGRKRTNLRIRNYKTPNGWYNSNLNWYEIARDIKLFLGDRKVGLVPNIPEVKDNLNGRVPPPLNLKDKDSYMRMVGFEPLPLQRLSQTYTLPLILEYSLKHYGPLHIQIGKPNNFIFLALLGIITKSNGFSYKHVVTLGSEGVPNLPMEKFEKELYSPRGLPYFYSPVYYFRGKNYSATELFRRRKMIYG